MGAVLVVRMALEGISAKCLSVRASEGRTESPHSGILERLPSGRPAKVFEHG